jgi:polyisoprenoid-binding protein YceI
VNMPLNARPRLLGTLVLAAIAAIWIAGLAALAVRGAVAQESTPGVIGTPTAASGCAADAQATPAAGQTAYTIVSEESAARYRAQEELAGQGAAEAVGETTAIIGTILFDAEANPQACSRFDVDLRTLQSDEARRDNYLYSNTLETERFPLATFVLTGVEGLDGPLVDGEERTFTLVGELTMHGVTNLVTWEVTATLDGDTLSGSASTGFNMVDYDIEEPVVGPVLSVNETIQLEVDLTATRAN